MPCNLSVLALKDCIRWKEVAKPPLSTTKSTKLFVSQVISKKDRSVLKCPVIKVKCLKYLALFTMVNRFLEEMFSTGTYRYILL